MPTPSSHTSGRWSAINDRLGWYVYAMPYDDTSYPICVIGTLSPGCNEANARLIAAAPELLEALKEAQRILRRDNGAAPQLVEDALAKAEGKA